MTRARELARTKPMRITLISDTHMHHEQLAIEACDVLVHAGDFSRRGSRGEAERFLRWLGEQPARHRLLVAGNHDRWAEAEPEAFSAMAAEHGVRHLLLDSISIEGLKFFGAPYTLPFYDWAFQAPEERLRQYWSIIPSDVDVLITHGPPAGILDVTHRGEHIGCVSLRERLESIAPKLHVFGHVHESRGTHLLEPSRTLFVNAANRDHPSPGMRPAMVVTHDEGRVMLAP